jgi:chromosome segregation protein
VNFNKIEMQGFKSFADKTKIEFDSEVTAIVGPNGCGKSNVADAVRWVLGEQSAKTLRGKHMQDVIFNGTENRKSTSYCEVSLFFDNKARVFNVGFDELVLTRKLDRSGDSEYLINGTNCRLKDIVDLLRDTGAGREGYSIIGQGRIDEILSAKPDDRRNIFEEAAGIAKSKSKKVEAERKLVRTRENLSRHEDIMGELFRQLEPLKAQADDAKKCQEFKDELKLNEVNAYIYQYENNEKERSEINRKIMEIESKLAVERGVYDGLISSFNERLSGIGATDQKISELREELTEYLVGAEKNAGELRLHNEKIGNLRAEEGRLKREIDSRKNILDGIKNSIEKNRAETESIDADIAAQKANLEKADCDLNKLKESLNEREASVENGNKSIIENMRRLSEIKSNMSQLLKEKELLEETRASAAKKLEETEAAEEVRAEIESVLARQAEEIRKLIGECQKVLSDSERELAEKQIKIARGKEESKNLSGRIAALETKAKMLDDIKNEYEGYAYAVKKLMVDCKSDTKLSGRNLGVLAEAIKVDEKYEQAIDVALGAALQNVIVRDEEDAKYLIGYLKEKRYGRVTFLPLSSVKARVLEREYDGILKIPGCLGVASELIGYDLKFQGVVRNLLGRTVVVDNIDTAVAMAKRYGYAFRIVTLEGDILMTSGAISGGSRKSDNNADIISRDRNIAAAAAALTNSRGQYEMLERAIANAEKDLAVIKARTENAEKELKKNEIAYAAAAEKLEKAEEEVKAFKREKSELSARYRSVGLRIGEIEENLGSVDKLEADIVRERRNIDSLREESRQDMTQKRIEREELENAITRAKVGLSERIKDKEAALSVIGELKTRAAETAAAILRTEGELAEVLSAAKEQEARAVAEAMSEDERRKIEELKTALAGLDEYKAECRRELAELEERRNVKGAEISELNEKKIREENLLERLDSEGSMLEEKVREEYGMDYAAALPFRIDGYDYQKSLTLINRLKKKINDLGDVNMRAVKDFEEVGGRYGEMAVQRDDMLKAESDLVGIIGDLTREMHAKFKTEFDKINENFTVIFKQLFNGGKANLKLEQIEGKDLLEAGIEIYAEPPGKKLQHISLLSGGEKALTAIAILFAILKLKPMPFCVLDEIEAALDDANANLFAEYLKKFSKNTQFIVITHRKPTMELADTLYGVTMEEKGVSKLVSVQLSDAVKNAEKAS